MVEEILNSTNIRQVLLEMCENSDNLSENILLEKIDLMLEDSRVDEDYKAVLKKAKEFFKWAKDKIKAMRLGLKKEKQETIDMVKIFFRLLKAKLKDTPTPSKEEIKIAILQLKDVAKVALVAAVLLGPLPGDEPLLIGLELLARHFGVSVFPSAMKGII